MANPVLVLKVIRLAGEMRVDRLLERTDVVGVDTVQSTPRDDRCRPAPAGRSSPSIGPRRRTPGCEDPIPTIRRSHLPPRARADLRCRLSACSARVRSVTSCQSSVTPPATGRILTCRIRAPSANGSSTRASVRALRSSGPRVIARGSSVWPRAGTTPTSERPRARSRGQPRIRSRTSSQSVTRPLPSTTAHAVIQRIR